MYAGSLADSAHMTCLDEMEISALLQQSIAADSLESVEEHLDGCDSCRRVIAARLRKQAVSLGWSQDQELNRRRSETTVLVRGQSISRYLVLDKIGNGNVGIVYAAYDPSLNRKIAIKVLRPSYSSKVNAQERLLLEAKAMARLSHPNVVVVHEVDRFEEQIFIAMEFVEGVTLRQWLREEERSWQDTVGCFAGAARGLAAAHQSDIIHRDFKCDNVFVGQDDRARVGDFGLVRMGEEDSSGAELFADIRVSLTQTGNVIGTPLYMAPECLEGRVADALSDQYSFCISMYEALYGEYPFAAKSVRVLQEAIANGEVKKLTSADAKKVPSKLRTVLLKGMSADRGNRYSDMKSLWSDVEHIAHTAKRSKWSVLGAGMAGVGAVVASFALFGETSQEPSLCKSSETEFIGIWDPKVKKNMAAAFARSGDSAADETYLAVEQHFHEYANTWKSMHTEACEATHYKGTQSSALLDLRMNCLGRHLLEFEAQTDFLVRYGTQKDTVKQAISSVEKLSPLGDCADVTGLQALVPMPAEPGLRREIDEVEGRVARIRTLLNARKAKEALPLVQTLVAETEGLEYAPTRARISYILGMAQLGDGDGPSADTSLQEALLLAAKGKDDRQIADTWLALMQSARVQSRFKEALDMQPWVTAALHRAGDDVKQRNTYLAGISALAIRTGNGQLAVTTLSELLAIAEEKKDDRRIRVLSGNLGAAYSILGQYSMALRYMQQSLQIAERDPSDQISLGELHTNISGVYQEMMNFEKAEYHGTLGLQTFENALGAEHPYVATATMNYGTLLSAQQKYAGAKTYYNRALRLQEKLTGKESVQLAEILLNVANDAADQGKFDIAVGEFQRAREIFDGQLQPEHPAVASTYRGLAFALMGAERAKEALPLMQKAHDLRIASDITNAKLADTKFGLALCLWELKRERAKALKLAKEAVALLRNDEAPSVNLMEMEEWVREREEG